MAQFKLKTLSSFLLDCRLEMHRNKSLRISAWQRNSVSMKAHGQMVAVAAFGQRALQEPILINFGTLAVSQNRLTVHKLDDATIAQVQETGMPHLPYSAPGLFQSGWVIEGTHDQPLVGNIVCMGGYQFGEDAWLIVMTADDTAFVLPWKPVWGEAEIENTFYEDLMLFVTENIDYRENGAKAIEFAVKLGALLDAEGTPVQVQVQTQNHGIPKHKQVPRQLPFFNWAVSRVSLKPRPPVNVVRNTGNSDQESEQTIDPSRTSEKRMVRGYVRNQAFGPGFAYRKLVYIEAHERTYWTSDRPLRVVVSGE